MKKIKLDELQLELMKVLWENGEATVQAIREALAEDKAIQTINTVLQRLRKKGIVDYRKEGRQYVYRALVSEEETKSKEVDSFVNRWFQGNSSVLVNHLIKEGDFEADELEQLKSLINKAIKKDNDHE